MTDLSRLPRDVLTRLEETDDMLILTLSPVPDGYPCHVMMDDGIGRNIDNAMRMKADMTAAYMCGLVSAGKQAFIIPLPFLSILLNVAINPALEMTPPPMATDADDLVHLADGAKPS